MQIRTRWGRVKPDRSRPVLSIRDAVDTLEGEHVSSNGRTGSSPRWGRNLVVTLALVLGVAVAAPAYGSAHPSARVTARGASRSTFAAPMATRRGAGAARASATPFTVPPLEYHGGVVQHASAIYAIYWVPTGYSLPAGYTSLLTQYFTDVAHDSFGAANAYSTDTQYYDFIGGVKRFISYSISYSGAVADTDPLPPDGCANYLISHGALSVNCLTSTQIDDEVSSFVAAHHLPTGVSTTYVLFTPEGLGSCDSPGFCYASNSANGYCAYHTATGFSPASALYAYVPYQAIYPCTSGPSPTGVQPNGNAADPAIDSTSHEINETITDPYGDAWWGPRDEIADMCSTSFGPALGSTAFGMYNQVINGHKYWMQEEWSNRAHACVQHNTFAQPKASFTVSPASPVHGSKAKLTAKAASTGDNQFTYRWVFPNGATSTAADPAFTFGKAGTARVVLIVFGAHGDQRRVVRTITVR